MMLGSLFVIDVIIARMASVESVGFWRQLMLIYQLLIPLFSLGVIEGFKYFISIEPKRLDSYYSIIIVFLLLISLLLFVIISLPFFEYFNRYILKLNILNDYKYVMPFLFLIVGFNLMNNYLFIILEKSKVIFISSLTFATCILISYLLLLIFHCPIDNQKIVTIFTISLLLQASVFLCFYKSKLIRFKFISDTKPLLKYGFPIWLASYIGVITLNIDKIIINNLGGITAFAVYSIGAFEFPLVTLISKSITSISTPEIIRSVNEKNISGAIHLWISNTYKITLKTYPIIILCIVFAKQFILFFFGHSFVDAIIIFKVYSLSLIWRNNFYGSILLANRQGSEITKMSFISLLINILSSIILYRFWGIRGVAMAIFISVSFLALALMWKEKSLINYFLLFKRPKFLILNILIFAAILW